MTRDTIFISHATPEDNEFTIWIASRLEALGYKVWIDKNGLLGGEKFWLEIDNVIRKKAIKFLLVYSENICYNKEAGNLKDGINNEFELAKDIGRKNNISDFIIPLKIDQSAYNLFIGANTYNHILFADNWAEGLKTLVKKLNTDSIFPLKNQDSSLKDWFEKHYVNSNGIISKNELYYSSWWAIEELPSKVYIFKFENKKQAEAVYWKNKDYPIGKISNILTTFASELDFTILDEYGQEITINYEELHILKTSDILLGFESNTFPTHRDTENHFKSLLRRVFHLIMRNKKLFWHEMSSKKISYYFPISLLFKDQVKFKYPYRKNIKRKKLIGKHKNLKWHYSISQSPILSPIMGFSIKHHLIFTNDGLTPLEDNKVMHSNRRAKGKRFFNEEWRDMQLAFIQALKDGNNEISIQVNKYDMLKMKLFPEMFWADFGYFEPSQKIEIDEDYEEYEY